MSRIFKYKILDEPSPYKLMLPKGAIILSAMGQGDDIYIWAMVDKDQPLTPRYILVLPTGVEITTDNTIVFIDSVQLYEGRLIFHIFEEIRV